MSTIGDLSINEGKILEREFKQCTINQSSKSDMNKIKTVSKTH